MDISATRSPSNGLERTAAAISQAEARFAQKADDVLTAIEPTSSDKDAAKQLAKSDQPEPDVAQAAVSLREQSLVNQVLFSTFKAQADQQRSAVKDLTGA